jgi:hypothetical protein
MMMMMMMMWTALGAWESFRESMKALAIDSQVYYELKQHKPWFDEECSKLLFYRKQTKLQ